MKALLFLLTLSTGGLGHKIHCMEHHSLEHTGGVVCMYTLCVLHWVSSSCVVSLVPGQSQSGEENYEH